MTKIISIINNKGGVGKTTTAINLSAALAQKGKKVGIIDLDGQSQTRLGFQLETTRIDLRSLIERRGGIEFKDFSPTQLADVYIIPNNGDINEKIFHTPIQGREPHVLKTKLIDFTGLDYIFIDCNPSLDLQAINGLIASDCMLVPTMMNFAQVQGTFTFLQKVEDIGIPLIGVLILDYTRYRWTFKEDTEKLLEERMGQYLFDTRILRNNQLDKVNLESSTIFDTTMRNRGVRKGQEDFLKLADEFMQRIEKI